MTTPAILKGAIAVALLALAAGCVQQSEGQHDEPTGHAPVATSSSAGFPDGHAAAGQKLASAKRASGQACVDCHGAGGNAPIDPSYPVLAGQYQDYLAFTLRAYREGGREHALMSGQAKDLTDQEIAHLAAYFASVPGNLRDLSNME